MASLQLCLLHIIEFGKYADSDIAKSGDLPLGRRSLTGKAIEGATLVAGVALNVTEWSHKANCYDKAAVEAFFKTINAKLAASFGSKVEC